RIFPLTLLHEGASPATVRVEDNNHRHRHAIGRRTAWRLPHSAMSGVRKERAFRGGLANGRSRTVCGRWRKAWGSWRAQGCAIEAVRVAHAHSGRRILDHRAKALPRPFRGSRGWAVLSSSLRVISRAVRWSRM